MIDARIYDRTDENFDHSILLNRCFGFSPEISRHQTAPHLQIRTARTGHPVVRKKNDRGAWIHLHSTIDPDSEARALISNLDCGADCIFVVLGAGLGYHIGHLQRLYPESPIAVVDSDHHMFNALLGCAHACSIAESRNIYFITGNTCDDVMEHLSHIQNIYGYLPFTVVSHPASLRADNRFYSKVRGRIDAAGKINLKSRFNYSKCTSKQLNVLILQSKYYLIAEVAGALKQLGHNTRCIMIETGEEGQGSNRVIENLIAAILEFKPDFILTVNHLGFDREGILIKLFTDIELPCVSWYVDSPVFILENYQKQVSPYLHIFLWDKDYAADLHKKGFESVHYLPLATDPGIFRPIQQCENPFRPHTCSTGFVGNSWQTIIDDCTAKMPSGAAVCDVVDAAAAGFIKSGCRYPGQVLYDFDEDLQGVFAHLMNTCRETFEPLITWRATQLYRTECIRQLGRFCPTLCGDPYWREILNGQFRLLPELNYYDELPHFYNVCRINLNTTSAQMKTGVNQRVFDVPACGAFLITDYRSQMEDLFDMGAEVVTYSDPAEIPSLVEFYLAHDSDRRRLAENARRRVLAHHTYMHRMQSMIQTVRRIHG